MKFFLDTANVKEIQEAASLGLLDGVTTNPSLVAKEGRSFKEMLDRNLQHCGWADQCRSRQPRSRCHGEGREGTRKDP